MLRNKKYRLSIIILFLIATVVWFIHHSRANPEALLDFYVVHPLPKDLKILEYQKLSSGMKEWKALYRLKMSEPSWERILQQGYYHKVDSSSPSYAEYAALFNREQNKIGVSEQWSSSEFDMYTKNDNGLIYLLLLDRSKLELWIILSRY